MQDKERELKGWPGRVVSGEERLASPLLSALAHCSESQRSQRGAPRIRADDFPKAVQSGQTAARLLLSNLSHGSPKRRWTVKTTTAARGWTVKTLDHEVGRALKMALDHDIQIFSRSCTAHENGGPSFLCSAFWWLGPSVLAPIRVICAHGTGD